MNPNDPDGFPSPPSPIGPAGPIGGCSCGTTHTGPIGNDGMSVTGPVGQIGLFGSDGVSITGPEFPPTDNETRQQQHENFNSHVKRLIDMKNVEMLRYLFACFQRDFPLMSHFDYSNEADLSYLEHFIQHDCESWEILEILLHARLDAKGLFIFYPHECQFCVLHMSLSHQMKFIDFVFNHSEPTWWETNSISYYGLSMNILCHAMLMAFESAKYLISCIHEKGMKIQWEDWTYLFGQLERDKKWQEIEYLFRSKENVPFEKHTNLLESAIKNQNIEAIEMMLRVLETQKCENLDFLKPWIKTKNPKISLMIMEFLIYRKVVVTPPNFSCVICLENPKVILADRCKHLLYCQECFAKNISTICPLCRSPVENFTQIFI